MIKADLIPQSAEGSLYLEFSSPLLGEVLQAVSKPDRKFVVLDLGSALGANVEFFSGICCKLYIEDFYRNYIPPVKIDKEDSQLKGFFGDFFKYPADLKFDLILCWDLFSYLHKSECAYLMAYLASHCNTGALVHMFMATRNEIPQNPGLFRVAKSGKVSFQSLEKQFRSPYLYSQPDLAKILTGFSSYRSVLHRNGFQEDVYKFGIY